MVLLILGISLGAALLAAGAFYLLHQFGDFFSYNALTKSDVFRVRKELSKHYVLLSSVKGRTLLGGATYWRGIYLPKGGGYPLYYRYQIEKNGVDASFNSIPCYMNSGQLIRTSLVIKQKWFIRR